MRELILPSPFCLSKVPKLAYKPHSVRVYAAINAGDHLSGSDIAAALMRPTRTLAERAAPMSCLALLLAGFAWPATLLPLPVVSYTTVSPSLVAAVAGPQLLLSNIPLCCTCHRVAPSGC